MRINIHLIIFDDESKLNRYEIKQEIDYRINEFLTELQKKLEEINCNFSVRIG